ncbi:MAG: diguanylate cyclase, partial [Candidatus Hydrogenedentes bacterium]|nr:diguanylate cyclase [Candidatus Hydrogenedentota bacterium]
MRVLIAEDDLTSRNILAAILKKWGHDPVVTKDGAAAWNVLQQPDAPKLVLLDWNMPGMEGLEVCRRLRDNASSNPPYVILLTGRGEKGDIVRGLEAGANDYIAKPYDNEELQARIGVGKRMLELQASLLDTRDALEHLAMHDPLTGIFNRRAILDRLRAEISRARRDGGRLSVGMCDLDHFKKINDRLGHQAGDELLKAISKRLKNLVRSSDTVARMGGDEFMLLMP